MASKTLPSVEYTWKVIIFLNLQFLLGKLVNLDTQLINVSFGIIILQ